MKILLFNKLSGKKEIKEYPSNNINNPIIGLDKNLEIYGIVEEPVPDYDSNRFNLIKMEKLEPNNKFNNLNHLGTYTIYWKIEEKSDSEIISMLNTSIGNFLDSNYPEWERSKHAGESIRFMIKGKENWNSEDLIRISYIQSIADWCRSCRLLRDEKEKLWIKNHDFPDLNNWPERPKK